MPYEWEEWALRALLGIEPYEVRQALEHKGRWPRPGTDPSTGLRLLTIWGRTFVGRPLVVAVYHVEGFTWKIIGAREMTADELGSICTVGGDAMTDGQELPQTPEEVNRLMTDLTFDDPPSSEAAEALLATLPPTGSEVMVVRSLRLPLDLDEAVSAAARTSDIPKSTWIRQAIEMALAMQAEEDQPISRSDALRALTLLRPVRRVA